MDRVVPSAADAAAGIGDGASPAAGGFRPCTETGLGVAPHGLTPAATAPGVAPEQIRSATGTRPVEPAAAEGTPPA